MAWRVLLPAVPLYELLGLFVEAVEEQGAGGHEAEHEAYPDANRAKIKDMAEEVSERKAYEVI